MTTDFTARNAVCWTGGSLVRGGAKAVFSGAAIDSRVVERGELFVAIRGPHHDGHRFLDAALERGARGLLVARDAELPTRLEGDPAVIAVDDTTAGLGTLAAGHRARFRGPVIAITGSNGKTTTKEMCASILSVRAPCHKTAGNLNNEYGLPLTLLARRPEHASAVVELGMNHRGEIARLARIARPTVGVLTNVGTAHIEHLGSRDEIAREKGDLLAALGSDGIAVVNRDDPRADAQAARAGCRVLRFGHDPSADVRARRVRFDDAGAFHFELLTPGGRCEVQVAGLSETAIVNALAAAAAALAAGATLDDVAAGLARFENVSGRMAQQKLDGDVMLIDDTYNANPQSVRAALESLSQLKGKGRGIAVLGDMGELGAEADQAHREAGRWAAELGIERLFALGDRAELVAAGAADGGMPESHVRADTAADTEGAATALAELLEEGDWLLVKGSRAMHMENVIESLTREWTERRRGGAH